ncbi:Uncharacterized protein HZ326_23571 [Fusarium oxysporum f. sp. albedinis]|nr:Uncharacterized protein HZ326_23571 [Fusarium oxysporum f. sp. albedinis]
MKQTRFVAEEYQVHVDKRYPAVEGQLRPVRIQASVGCHACENGRVVCLRRLTELRAGPCHVHCRTTPKYRSRLGR